MDIVGCKTKYEKGLIYMEWTNLPSRKKVLEQIFSLWKPEVQCEHVGLDDAIGRIYAEDALSVHDIPVVRASAMDGIGVISELFKDGIPDISQWVQGIEYVRADTGDDFPDEYDAVIPIEQLRFQDKTILEIDRDCFVSPGKNIVSKGSYLRKGELLVKKGTKLTPSDLAALAHGGITSVLVLKKPRVAFIPTGNELVPAGIPLKRGKSVDSNSILVRHTLNEAGAEPHCYPVVKDDSGQAKAVLNEALSSADIVIINGGSSKGEEDYNARLIKERGDFICHGGAAAPGKPMCISIINQKPVINLPGPSLAAYYGLDWCIKGLINHFLGISREYRRCIDAVLQEDIRYAKGMEILCKMELWQEDDGVWKTRQVPFRKSTVIENLTSPGQLITNPARDGYTAGQTVKVEIIR